MGKEAKLGVALIAVLLGAFGLVLYKRIKEATPSGDAVATAKAEEKPAAAEPEKPKLGRGPLKPTVVQSSPSGNAAQALANSPENSSRYGEYPSRPAATPAGENRATMDPLASAGSAASSRYGDRYTGTNQQIYGGASSGASEENAPATANEEVSTASTGVAANQADPFSYGNRSAGGTLTPTGDASAALLPASATTEAPGNPTADRSEVPERTAVQTNPGADSNPLRSAGADQSTVSSGGRSSASRGYDLYGDASSSTDSAPNDTPATSEAGSSRVRFGQSAGGARYASEPVTPTTDRGPPSRYSTSTAVTDVPASPLTTRNDSNRSGWSGAGATVSAGPSTTTSATAPPKSPATSAAPVTQSKPPRAVPAAVHRSDTHVVEPNDSFSTISEKLYGTSSYFKALQEHNKAKYPRPDRLRTGDVVATPSMETLLHNYPNLCPRPNHLPLPGRSSTLTSQRGGRVYVVEEGDTLFDIARFELGKATRWAEIYELNKDVIGEDFNHLRPGTQLVLPAEMRDDTFTRRPGISLPR